VRDLIARMMLGDKATDDHARAQATEHDD
jgi:hypothetical protein